MKKILLLIATAAGVLAIQKKLKDQQAELRHERQAFTGDDRELIVDARDVGHALRRSVSGD